MTIADLSLLFDAALAALLAVMIFYAVRLNKRIAMLRDGEGALQQMVAQFSEFSLAAQESARQLKAAGTEAEFGVKAAIAKGMALRNDLEMMLDQADLLVDRMDDDRYRVPPAASAPPAANQAAPRAAAPADPVPKPARSARPAPPEFQTTGVTSGHPAAANVQPFTPPVRSADEVVRATTTGPRDVQESADLQPRSEAERHLLDAIRAAKEGVV